MRAVTGLREVAERAGVSMRTVSNVVLGTGRFSEAARQRVERTVEELGHRPDSAARRLRAGRSGVPSRRVRARASVRPARRPGPGNAPYACGLSAVRIPAGTRAPRTRSVRPAPRPEGPGPPGRCGH
ncbi:LacI family DNA-binding transcriptional regulator [Streptomyces sp. NPDC000931]|uniref:LacI family DNA-binding transcriptional regulator n=1 Tax=Streptomyces sp. NPDC000931 TaxID=3154372 RepID=UPI00332EC288